MNCAGCGKPAEKRAIAHVMIGPSIVEKIVPLHLDHKCADKYDAKHRRSMWTIRRKKPQGS